MDTPTDATIDGFAYVPVSEHIDVYYDESEYVVAVAVDGRRIVYCAFLVASVVPSGVASDAISSIDALDISGETRRLEGMEAEEYLSPEEQVRAHASNLQAWVEHDYDTHLLHSSTAFTLLKSLTDVCDNKARHVLEGSIDERLHDGRVLGHAAQPDAIVCSLDDGQQAGLRRAGRRAVVIRLEGGNAIADLVHVGLGAGLASADLIAKTSSGVL